jgi:hypothetical protein
MPKSPTSTIDHSLGVTPIVIKRAAYYLCLGLGEYFPSHPHYDRVVVEKLYDIVNNPHNSLEWSMGIVVSFYKENRRMRWVDFGCRITGVGGDSLLRKVPDNE